MSTPLVTTLNKLVALHPGMKDCKKLTGFLGKLDSGTDDDPLPFSTIVAATDLDFALWCCASAPEYAREWQGYADWCLSLGHDPMEGKRDATRELMGIARNAALAVARRQYQSAIGNTGYSASAMDDALETLRRTEELQKVKFLELCK